MKNKNELLEQANKTPKTLSKDLTPDELVKVLCYALCVQNELDVAPNFRLNVLSVTGPRFEHVRPVITTVEL
jgi:hypothetical protein